MESVHKKLDKVRKPRVHITYDVETEGAEVTKELPFVVGVLGDFSGDAPKKPLKERKFVQIDQDNFDDVMSRTEPTLNLRVDNKLTKNDTEMSVQLKFNSMEDFEPKNVIEQVPALKKLLDTRNQLRDLLSKADRSEQLEELLEDILKHTDKVKQLAEELKSE